MEFHLAQANIAQGIASVTDPLMKGFVDQLDYINSVADRSPGFVWRLQTEEGDATSLQPFDDPLILVNMSVWESIDAFYDYVFRSDHAGPLKDRRRWFSKLDGPHAVMWWIRAGTTPDVADLKRRLDLLEKNGPAPEAFTLAKAFDPEGRPLERAARRDRECGV
ncbi:MAG: DUF3291 domain-containing protein [Gemmatimonadota bacterium]